MSESTSTESNPPKENVIKTTISGDSSEESLSSYLKNYALSKNANETSILKDVIDVQPDTRHIFHAITWFMMKKFRTIPKTDLTGYSSIFNMIGYCMSLVYYHLLHCDLNYRVRTSIAAADIRSHGHLLDIANVLKDCYVPPFLSDILISLAPYKDPKREGLRFCPTLAGYVDKYDFGRTLPPAIMYKVHNYVAAAAKSVTADTVLKDIYNLVVFRVNNVDRKIGHYFGTQLESGMHSNWVNQAFESLLKPQVYQAQLARPSLASTALRVENIDAHSDNIYAALLLMNSDNASFTKVLYKSLSEFTQKIYPNAKPYNQLEKDFTGDLLTCYAFYPPTLPTWTSLQLATGIKTDIISDPEYATLHQFLHTQENGAEQYVVPNVANFRANLFHIQAAAHVAADDPRPPVAYDNDITPDPPIDIFMPGSSRPQIRSLILTCGLIIEHGELTGFSIPIENPALQSIAEENALYLQTAIPIENTYPVFSQTTANDSRIILHKSEKYKYHEQPVIINMYNAAEVTFPRIDNANVQALPDAPAALGMEARDHFLNLQTGFNVKGGTAHQQRCTQKVFLWASPRHVVDGIAAKKKVSLLASLRTLYGTQDLIARVESLTLNRPVISS